MDQLEDDLRASFARQVAAPPVLPHLADSVLRRGRRVRRRRTAAGALAGVALLAAGVAGAGVAASVDDVAQWAGSGESPRGLPRVPVLVEGSLLVDWPGGVERVRELGRQGAVLTAASVPGGVLLLREGDQGGEIALLADDSDTPRPLLRTELFTGVAYAEGGRVAAVVQDGPAGRVLREVRLSTGDVLAETTIDDRVAPGERVFIAGYSGRSVLVDVGEGSASRVLLWDPVAGSVVALPGGYQARGSGPTALIALDALQAGERCRTRVFPNGRPDGGWSLCEGLVAFSPDGERTLSTDRLGERLVVRDARTGERQQRVGVDEHVRDLGWESAEATLHVTTDEDGTSTLIVRCMVESGRCATAVSFPYVDKIPRPVGPA